jgi:hypothetical protein
MYSSFRALHAHATGMNVLCLDGVCRWRTIQCGSVAGDYFPVVGVVGDYFPVVGVVGDYFPVAGNPMQISGRRRRRRRRKTGYSHK